MHPAIHEMISARVATAGVLQTLRGEKSGETFALPARGPVVVSADFTYTSGAGQTGAYIVAYGVAAGGRVPLDVAVIASDVNTSRKVGQVAMILAGHPFREYQFDVATYNGQVRLRASYDPSIAVSQPTIYVPNYAVRPSDWSTAPSDLPTNVGRMIQRVSASALFQQTAPTLFDGAQVPLNLDSRGRLKTRHEASAVNKSKPALGAARAKTWVVKATAGNLFGFFLGYAASATVDGYIQMHDVAAAGSVATGTMMGGAIDKVTPGESRGFAWENPIEFDTGITIAISTTEDTYTAPAEDKALVWSNYD